MILTFKSTSGEINAPQSQTMIDVANQASLNEVQTCTLKTIGQNRASLLPYYLISIEGEFTSVDKQAIILALETNFDLKFCE